MFLCQWIYPGAMHQPTGEDQAGKEDGAKEGSKGEWPKDLGAKTMHALIADRWDTMPETVHRDEGRILNQT